MKIKSENVNQCQIPERKNNFFGSTIQNIFLKKGQGMFLKKIGNVLLFFELFGKLIGIGNYSCSSK